MRQMAEGARLQGFSSSSAAFYPRKRSIERLELRDLRAVVSRQILHARRETLAAQDFEELFQRQTAQRGFRTREKVALDGERHEGELEARSVRTQSEARVGPSIGDRRGHRNVHLPVDEAHA